MNTNTAAAATHLLAWTTELIRTCGVSPRNVSISPPLYPEALYAFSLVSLGVATHADAALVAREHGLTRQDDAAEPYGASRWRVRYLYSGRVPIFDGMPATDVEAWVYEELPADAYLTAHASFVGDPELIVAVTDPDTYVWDTVLTTIPLDTGVGLVDLDAVLTAAGFRTTAGWKDVPGGFQADVEIHAPGGRG